VTQAVIWFSGTSLKWWNQDGTITLTATQPNPTNSSADVTGAYTDHQTYDDGNGGVCTIDWSGHPDLHQAPVGVNVAHLTFSPTTGAATANQGLSVVGWPVPIPQLDSALTGSDGCSGGAPPPYFFDWYGALSTQQYPLTLDAAKGDVIAGWDHTADESGAGFTRTIDYTINANLHVAGLKEFLAAGKP